MRRGGDLRPVKSLVSLLLSSSAVVVVQKGIAGHLGDSVRSGLLSASLGLNIEHTRRVSGLE